MRAALSYVSHRQLIYNESVVLLLVVNQKMHLAGSESRKLKHACISKHGCNDDTRFRIPAQSSLHMSLTCLPRGPPCKLYWFSMPGSLVSSPLLNCNAVRGSCSASSAVVNASVQSCFRRLICHRTPCKCRTGRSWSVGCCLAVLSCTAQSCSLSPDAAKA